MAFFPRLLLCLASLVAIACETSSTAGPAVVTVMAASSLTEAFTELAQAFERAHPGVQVRLSFAGSQVLRTQIEHGARADVFASADEAHMQALRRAGRVEDPQTFAHNALVVIVPVSNPAAIARFEDLARARRIVLGGEQVPVGRYSRILLQRARASYGDDFAEAVQRHVVSEETNVRLVRAKVQVGEADAAIVYRTDAVGVSGLLSVEVPAPLNARADYPIARLKSAPAPELGQRVIEFIRSEVGQAVLARHGFIPEEP